MGNCGKCGKRRSTHLTQTENKDSVQGVRPGAIRVGSQNFLPKYERTTLFGALQQPLRISLGQKLPYVACVGGSATFGPHHTNHWPALLSQQLSRTFVNFGHVDAGPDFFLADTIILEAINLAELVVLQVMGVETVTTSHYCCHATVQNRLERVTVPTLEPYKDCKTVTELLQRVSERDVGLAVELVQEARTTYLRRMQTLIEAIQPPIVLFWFSEREPEDDTRSSLAPYVTKAPQLVTAEIFHQLLGLCDSGVVCCSTRGMPTVFMNEPGGIECTLEYPSAEMHDDAREALAAVIPSALSHKIV